MAIPETAEFRALIGSLRTSQPTTAADEYARVLVRDARPAHRRQLQSDPEIAIWHRVGTISFDALVGKVAKELSTRGHPHSKPVVLHTLALFAHVSAPRRTEAIVVAMANEMLARVQNASVTQTCILGSLRPGDEPLEVSFGPFSLGPLDEVRMASRCKKAKSDFFERHRERLTGRIALEQAPRPVAVIPWADVLRTWWPHPIQPNDFVYRLVDLYYYAVATDCFEQFWRELGEQQHLWVTCGAPYLDERVIQRVADMERVSIFWNVASIGGWVAPDIVGQIVELGAARRLPPVIAMLQDLGWQGYSGSEMSNTLRHYAHFVSRATRHRQDGNNDEGFLHFVIALDLLLGEEGASTRAVSARAAALIAADQHRYSEAKKVVKKLYDARSKYVHAGQPCPEELGQQALEVCQQLALSLIRVVVAERSTGPIAFDRWLKTVDFISTALEAGKSLDRSDLHFVGIKTDG